MTNKPKTVDQLQDDIRRIELELANAGADDARHAAAMDALCLARRNLNLATGQSPYRDYIPHPAPRRNDRIL
jgi:hypothetical protein